LLSKLINNGLTIFPLLCIQWLCLIQEIILFLSLWVFCHLITKSLGGGSWDNHVINIHWTSWLLLYDLLLLFYLWWWLILFFLFLLFISTTEPTCSRGLRNILLLDKLLSLRLLQTSIKLLLL
jgi:hypothetical protein